MIPALAAEWNYKGGKMAQKMVEMMCFYTLSQAGEIKRNCHSSRAEGQKAEKKRHIAEPSFQNAMVDSGDRCETWQDLLKLLETQEGCFFFDQSESDQA